MIFARLVQAPVAGASVNTQGLSGVLQELGATSHGVASGADLRRQRHLAEPFAHVPVLPQRSRYAGEPIGVIWAPSWRAADELADRLTFTVAEPIATPAPPAHSEPVAEQDQILDSVYRIGAGVARVDQALWCEIAPDASELRLTCTWPGLVRSSVADVFGRSESAVRVQAVALPGLSDRAIVLPVLVAIAAGLVARRVGSIVRLVVPAPSWTTIGRRPGASVRWVSQSSGERTAVRHQAEISLATGTDDIDRKVIRDDFDRTVARPYHFREPQIELRFAVTPGAPPPAYDEGTVEPQLTFAREVQLSRLAHLAGRDPLEYRESLLGGAKWKELCTRLAAESDFHRRYAAHELLRKRRAAGSGGQAELRGVGCALAAQRPALPPGWGPGQVSVRLEQDGTVTLGVGAVGAGSRLIKAWRNLVAEALSIEPDRIRFSDNPPEPGPEIGSRSVTEVARALDAACRSINKRRFHDPLPLQSRRKLAAGPSADALAGCVTEVRIDSSSLQLIVEAVYIVVWAGRLLDRHGADLELRRSVDRALHWMLHDRQERAAQGVRIYPPKVRTVFIPSQKRDPVLGLSTLAMQTVPAAICSAVSQAADTFYGAVPVDSTELFAQMERRP